MNSSYNGQKGFTLIELIVALVIIALAASTIIGLMSTISSRSAAVAQQSQAATIANSYLRNALAQPFAALAAGLAINQAGAQDQFGNAIAGLENFQIDVVSATSANLLPNVPFVDCALITITVTAPDGGTTVLSAYRTRHP
jgi:prepilin-type N-terminal cleavage/methylation domain-containing protein